MSDTGNERPAGWYHAEGDPPGTQRYWDGSAWQGGPQAAPDGGLGGGALGGAAAQAMTAMPGMGDNNAGYKGFFPTLFDFSLSSFLTPKVIRILYIVGVILTCLGGAAYLFIGLASGSGILILFVLVFVPIFTLLYLIMIRISTEFVIIAFRTYEEVKQLRADLE